MASPKPFQIVWEQEDHTLDGGKPTGDILFIALPEPTYAAISDAASKRGITVTQAIANAISVYLKSP